MEQLLARQAITEVVFRYARAVDRMDESLLRSVFHPGSRHNHFYEGPSSDPDASSTPEEPGDFVTYALTVLGGFTRTHHQLGNTLIEFYEEDIAQVETYFTAFHRMRAADDPLAGANAFDTEMDYFVGGRYIDRFALRDGTWKIIERVGMTDWTRIEPPTSQGFADIDPKTIGQRAPHDYICQSV